MPYATMTTTRQEKTKKTAVLFFRPEVVDSDYKVILEAHDSKAILFRLRVINFMGIFLAGLGITAIVMFSSNGPKNGDDTLTVDASEQVQKNFAMDPVLFVTLYLIVCVTFSFLYLASMHNRILKMYYNATDKKYIAVLINGFLKRNLEFTQKEIQHLHIEQSVSVQKAPKEFVRIRETEFFVISEDFVQPTYYAQFNGVQPVENVTKRRIYKKHS